MLCHGLAALAHMWSSVCVLAVMAHPSLFVWPHSISPAISVGLCRSQQHSSFCGLPVVFSFVASCDVMLDMLCNSLPRDDLSVDKDPTWKSVLGRWEQARENAAPLNPARDSWHLCIPGSLHEVVCVCAD